MPVMPHWAQYFILASLLIGALAVIWTKFVHPLSKLIVFLSQILPMLQDFLEKDKKDPDYQEVLFEIAKQFKTDSGSSLRDVINRLEQASIKMLSEAEDLRVKAGVIKEEVAVVKELAKTDRAEMSKDRIAADHKLTMLDDVLLRMKHLEGLLLVAQSQPPSAPIAPQQLIPTALAPNTPPGTNVIAVVEAHKVDS